MPEKEKECLQKYINCSKNIVEYGGGGSTICAIKSKVHNIFCVENDKDWLKIILEEYHKINGEKAKLHTSYCNTGPVKRWGYPIYENYKSSGVEYVTNVWKKVEKEGVSPDFVLIDGRLRVASFIYSISKVNPGTVIFWDDYVERNYYHCVEKIIKPSKIVGRAAIFIANNNSLDQEMFDIYKKDFR